MKGGAAKTFLLVVLAFHPAHAETAPSPPLGLAGGFGKGVGIDLLGLGPAESWTRFGSAAGISLTTAVQFDLGSRWAMRFPVSLDLTVQGQNVAYGALAFTPGILYRWRWAPEQRWVPYVGGGVRLASNGVRRDFVGRPLLVASLLSFDEHHDWGGGSDPNIDAQFGLGPELWAGYELHLNRWIALNFGLAYAWIWIDGESVNLLRETGGIRFTL